jgi:hypothetical protein
MLRVQSHEHLGFSAFTHREEGGTPTAPFSNVLHPISPTSHPYFASGNFETLTATPLWQVLITRRLSVRGMSLPRSECQVVRSKKSINAPVTYVAGDRADCVEG